MNADTGDEDRTGGDTGSGGGAGDTEPPDLKELGKRVVDETFSFRDIFSEQAQAVAYASLASTGQQSSKANAVTTRSRTRLMLQ